MTRRYRRGRPPGRRPGTADTRGEILAAARREFADSGYDATTIRGIARSAGVDPALVHHYFGSKDNVFEACLELTFDPLTVAPRLVAEGPEGVGERVIRFFFSVWEDPEGQDRLLAVIRSALTNDRAAEILRTFLARELIGRIAHALAVPDPEVRATLVGSQMVGLAVARYAVRVEPLASADPETIIELVAPTIQHYLTTP
ncbi:MAG: TetR family transcriptional regulator [Carbonactinosporaceae bacterium]